ncbi:MAG TPA: DUF4178 domain-containing protein [Gemmataceae bacterium]|nr:DUF4178 domain-containing protein [Gemmataceae bacterium]
MPLRVVQCPWCGGTVELHRGKESAPCRRCGATVTREDLRRADAQTAGRFVNTTPLRLGMTARFDGKEYELIGRMVLGMIEEGVTYFWDEFVLVGPDGQVLFVEYDEGRWLRMEPFTPWKPLTPAQARKLVVGSSFSPGKGPPATVNLVSRATVHRIEGDLPWPARVGDARDYCDAQRLNELYAVEWDDEEVECFRGRLLSRREVYEAFGLKEELAALDAQERHGRSMMYFACCCLGLALMAFILWAVSGHGRVVGRGRARAEAIVGPDGLRFGPLELSPDQRVHRLTVYSALTQPSAWVNGTLRRDDGTEQAKDVPTGTLEAPDAASSWSTFPVQGHQDFVVRQGGPYYMYLTVQGVGAAGPPGAAPPVNLPSNVGFEVRSGLLYPGYLLAYALGLLIGGAAFLIVGAVLKWRAEC